MWAHEYVGEGHERVERVRQWVARAVSEELHEQRHVHERPEREAAHEEHQLCKQLWKRTHKLICVQMFIMAE